MKNKTFEVGDLVYIPEQDPNANTIWLIDKIRNGQVSLYHPFKGELIVGEQEIEDSPF